MGAMRAGQRNVDPPVALVIVFALAGLLVIGASIGMLVGMVRCTNVPQESGSTRLCSGGHRLYRRELPVVSGGKSR